MNLMLMAPVFKDSNGVHVTRRGDNSEDSSLISKKGRYLSLKITVLIQTGQCFHLDGHVQLPSLMYLYFCNSVVQLTIHWRNLILLEETASLCYQYYGAVKTYLFHMVLILK